MVRPSDSLTPKHWLRFGINASDIFNRTPFVFSDETFALCKGFFYPIATAVAASAAMPVIFAPVSMRTFPDRCASAITNRVLNGRGVKRLLLPS